MSCSNPTKKKTIVIIQNDPAKIAWEGNPMQLNKTLTGKILWLKDKFKYKKGQSA